MRTAAISVAFLLGGCAITPTPQAPASREVISLWAGGGPFCFPCTYDEMSIRGDGRIKRTRWSWNAVTKERRVLLSERRRVSPEQVARMRSELARHRPNGSRVLEGATDCAQDQGDARITWKDQTEDQLAFELGCASAELSELRSALVSLTDIAGVAPIRW
jgi:hypothetical protein